MVNPCSFSIQPASAHPDPAQSQGFPDSSAAAGRPNPAESPGFPCPSAQPLAEILAELAEEAQRALERDLLCAQQQLDALDTFRAQSESLCLHGGVVQPVLIKQSRDFGPDVLVSEPVPRQIFSRMIALVTMLKTLHHLLQQVLQRFEEGAVENFALDPAEARDLPHQRDRRVDIILLERAAGLQILVNRVAEPREFILGLGGQDARRAQSPGFSSGWGHGVFPFQNLRCPEP
jgi:hypothetical protein